MRLFILFFFILAVFGLMPAAAQTLDDAFRGLSDERDALKEEVAMLKVKQQAAYDDLKKKIELVTEERDDMQKKLSVLEERMAYLEEENTALSSKKEDAQYNLEKLNEVLRDKDVYIREAEEEKRQLGVHLDRAESALQKASVRIQKLQVENEELKKELSVCGFEEPGKKAE